MLIDVMRQVTAFIAFVKNVAANDQIELAAHSNVLLLCGVFTPVPMSVVHRA